jgi:hypothetical protein
MGRQHRTRPGRLWHPFIPQDESVTDLPADEEHKGGTIIVGSYQVGKHGTLLWKATCYAQKLPQMVDSGEI